MNHHYASTILCFQDFKEAALYFDRVLPLNLGRMQGDPDIGDILVGYPESIPSVALSHLIDGIEGNNVTYSHASRIIELTSERWVEFARNVSPYAKLWASDPRDEPSHDPYVEHQKLLNAYLSNAQIKGAPPVRKTLSDFANSLGLSNFSVALPAVTTGGQSDPSLMLSNLKLIDAKMADWRQILEIRKDDLSRRKLARMRLFLNENFQGKSASFIEDDLLRRVDDYELATKKFGFTTLTSSLSMLLDAKSLQTSIGTGAVAGLFGGLEIGLLSAAVIELGKVAINIAEKRHNMKHWQAGHEMAYIFETQGRICQ
ncbi:hypothetical protein JYG38_15310 [Pseudomonas rhodesiae]|uniref:hypothetical protein n=1 Tax=Pseudomonas rhodesiae TaxID=76760 RepID=UPI001BD109DF|nr:hypothetical protein [Pseudomonas rhodesiae]QVM99620.1 hypothetical protein JYG38_15310 [Pseudomonas rhodesiae]